MSEQKKMPADPQAIKLIKFGNVGSTFQQETFHVQNRESELPGQK
jgi:hypothetical protein